MKRPEFTDSTGREVVDIEVHVDRRSSVDSYIESAVYMDDGTEVPEEELEYLQDAYADWVQDYAYNNGSSNHN